MNIHFAAHAKKEAEISNEEEPPSREDASNNGCSFSLGGKIKNLLVSLQSLVSRKPDSSLQEAIEEVLVEHEEETGDMPAEEKAIIKNVLAFGHMCVGDIMILRSDIVAVPHDISLDALKAHILDQRHTRIPVYKESLDHVQGFLHIKDLFGMVAGDQPYTLEPVLRPMLFVPPSMPISDLLVKMRRLGSHMAIVVDEYGGTDGLVTLEDVFEEIVGDIQDEHDEEEHERQFVRLSAHVVEVDARIPIETLEADLGLRLMTDSEEEESDFETLGGLIFFQLGRVPSVGETIPYESGLSFEIIEADPRRISKVRIHGVA